MPGIPGSILPADDPAITSRTQPQLVDGEHWIWRTASTFVEGALDTPGGAGPLGATSNTYSVTGDLLASSQSVISPRNYKFAVPPVEASQGGADGLVQLDEALVASSVVDTWGQSVASCVGADIGAVGSGLLAVPAECMRYAVVERELVYAQLVLTEVAFTGRGPSEALVTHGTWDRGLGVLTTARDPNDLVTQVSYDGLGRLTSVTPVGAFLGGACEAPPRACEPSPMTTRRGFLFGFAVGLTLSLGVALGSMFTPRATAQATTPGPTRWEYTTVRHGFDGGSWANEQGAHGWRFIGFDGGDAHVQIFERPMH